MTHVQDRSTKTPADPTERLGLVQSSAPVMGSVIGISGFSLPYAIAANGPISPVEMRSATLGAIALAMMFAAMSGRLAADGGPQCRIRWPRTRAAQGSLIMGAQR